MSGGVIKPNTIVYVASCVAAIGGLLFGYDMGIISGAKTQLQRDLKLSCGQLESVVTMLPIGALVASILGGNLLALNLTHKLSGVDFTYILPTDFTHLRQLKAAFAVAD